jgi:hypothetical protein
MASVHQKQPPPKVAVSVCPELVICVITEKIKMKRNRVMAFSFPFKTDSRLKS